MRIVGGAILWYTYQQLIEGELRLYVKSWGRKSFHRLGCIHIDAWTDPSTEKRWLYKFI